MLLFIVFLACISCGDTAQKTNTATQTQDETKLKTALDQLEQELLNSRMEKIDFEKAAKLVNLSIQYVDAFPEASNSPVYLFRAGEVCVALKKHDKALDLWERLRNTYPSHPKAPIALFLQGFTADGQMQNKEKATAYYQLFLKLYPKHEQAAQVKLLLQNLSLTPEELIESFKKQNQ